MRIFIPFNTPSSKNSRQGRFFSKTVRRYLQKLGVKNYSMSKKSVENYKTRPNLFEKSIKPMREHLKDRQSPYLVGFYFVRGTKHRFDFVNVCQIICDLLVAHGVIEDDNMDYLIPYPLPAEKLTGFGTGWYGYDKETPGVWLDF